jgi:hypothetical protein
VRRLIPSVIMALLAITTAASIIVGVSQSPRYFGIPNHGSIRAKQRLQNAALATEYSESFTELTVEHNQVSGSELYQSPDKTLSSFLGFTQINVGSYMYFGGCPKRKWERLYQPNSYGPDGIMYDLDLLLYAQKVNERGHTFLATYVAPGGSVEVEINARVKSGRVVREAERFIYGSGTGWYLGPFRPQNHGYALIYSKIGSSPPIKVPPVSEVNNIKASKSGATLVGNCSVPGRFKISLPGISP